MTSTTHDDATTSDIVTTLVGDDADWTKRARFRASCRRSLYFLTKTVVCANESPNLMTAETFLESCEWLQFVLTEGKLGLFEDSRNLIKSTRSTVAIPIWVAIQRASVEYDLPAEVERASSFLAVNTHIKGPDTLIGIASENVSIAAEWATMSRRLWELNSLLRWAFPELLWPNVNAREYGEWEREAYTLPGRRNPTERNPFVRAIGTTSAVSGTRLDILLIDDLLSEKSSSSPTEVTYRRDWLLSISQLLREPDYNAPGASVTLLIENRWCLDDPNSMIHDRHPEWHVWSRAVWECGVHGRGNCGRKRSDADDPCPPTERSIWPERHRDLDAIRRRFGDSIYYTQWGNRPTRKSELDATCLTTFVIEARVVESRRGEMTRQPVVVVDAVFDVESGTATHADEAVALSLLAHPMVVVDPAGADKDSVARKAGRTARWAISTFALDAAVGRVFWIDCRADHWTPDDAIDQLVDAWLDMSRLFGYRLPVVSEKIAAQTLVGTAVRLACQGRALQPPDVIGARLPRDANTSIRAMLSWRLSGRRLYLRAGLNTPRAEVRHFPHGTNDTLVTAALYEQQIAEYLGVASTGDDLDMASRVSAARSRVANAGVTGAW